MIWIKILSLNNKDLAGSGRRSGGNPGGGPPKFAGMSHDVLENKGQKKFIRRKSNDVDENKRVRYFCHDVCENKGTYSFFRTRKIRVLYV
jgi:hypothetical protein